MRNDTIRLEFLKPSMALGVENILGMGKKKSQKEISWGASLFQDVKIQSQQVERNQQCGEKSR